MTQLASAVDAVDKLWTLDTLPPSPFVQVDDELIEISATFPEQIYQPTQELRPPKIRVRRGVGGTTAASHAEDAELVAVYGIGADDADPTIVEGSKVIEVESGVSRTRAIWHVSGSSFEVESFQDDVRRGYAAVRNDGQVSIASRDDTNTGRGSVAIDNDATYVQYQTANGDDTLLITLDGTGLHIGSNNLSINIPLAGVPVIPASPNAQDIADVLVTLGLATQTA